MKLNLLNIFIILTLFFTVFSVPALSADISLLVDGKKIECDVPPVIDNNRTLVPARAFFESLGASVTWNPIKKQVSVKLNDTKIILVIGSNVAYVNSVIKILDSVPLVKDNRTLIPVRFVSENLGYDVSWDGSTQSVLLEKIEETVPDFDSPNTDIDKEDLITSTITSMVYSVSGNSFVIKFTFSSPLNDYSLYNLDNPIRTVLELKGASYDGSKTITVDDGGIKQIRMANHDSYYKVVADLDEVLSKKFVLATNKLSATLTFTLSEEIDDSTIESDLPSTDVPKEPEKAPNIVYDKYWNVKSDSIVVLDAGHGGTDVGAIGYNKEGEKVLYEKDLNLTITLEVARILKEKGIKVLLTRSDDTYISLSQRYNKSNSNDALLFVSIHHNSHESPDPYGSLTLYSAAKDKKYPNLKSSKSIAQTIQKHLTNATGLYDGGIRSEDDLAVLGGTQTSAVLIEVAFVSSYDDQEFLLVNENLMKAAAGIADGILEVLGK